MDVACSRESELEDSLIAWQDKYERLHESYKRVQKVNQSLEDKLLKLADRNATERGQLTSDVATLSVRLAQANYNIGTLQRDIERYKTDMSLAIQLLQCKPDNFVSQKVASLPNDMQQKLSHYIRVDTNSHSDSEGSTSGIGTATDNAYHILPASDSPVSSYRFSTSTTTSLVYSNGVQTKQNFYTTNNGDEQLISPLGMAKYLEDKLKAANAKHCDTCLCATRDLRVLADIEPISLSVQTQTMMQTDTNYALCLRCNCNLNSPSDYITSSPYMMNLVKSCDSIMSDVKNGISCIESSDKMHNGKKDELMVNPILGHTPISERAARKQTTPNRSTCATPSTILTHSKPFTSNNIANATDGGNESSNDIDMRDNISKDDEISLNKDTNRTHGQIDRTTNSSSSLSNRSSIAVLDGPKLFESFNRNLIKSIKAEKPNVSGPRLCALRISNASGNVLIDNVESDSTPIVYRRRSRFVDEELDESKDIIPTHCFPTKSQCEDERTYHRISMVMSNGAIDTTNDTYNADMPQCQSSFSNIGQDCNGQLGDGHFQATQSSPGHIGDDSSAQNDVSAQNRLEIIGYDAVETINDSNSVTQQMQHSHISIRSTDNLSHVPNHQTAAIDITMDPNDKQFLNIHQLRQSRSMSFAEETSILRRRQLSRVAEWVQNNSNHRSCIDSTPACDTQQIDGNMNFDALSKIHINSTDVGNYSVDRILNNNNNNNDNCSDNNDSDIVSTYRKAIDCSQLNYNADSLQLKNTNQHVDLAQMEYNVKQFLLKQNEWSPKESCPTTLTQSSISSVSASHSYC